MIYKPKEFILKDGTKVILKSPEKGDARILLDNIIKVASSTDNLLSEPEDYNAYVTNIEKEETFIESYNTNKNYLICVYLNGKIIGNSSLNFHNHIKDRHRSSVGIAIQKEYWGLGIGSILFDEMIKIAKNTEGIEQIELDVISTNERAKNLYTKKGFVKVGDIPHQLKLKDGRYLNGESMILFLK
ncbi:GNAT family N-acetyltransferase [bacterium]|nr:GNAT family N-acetyltransferase [bacterium]